MNLSNQTFLHRELAVQISEVAKNFVMAMKGPSGKPKFSLLLLIGGSDISQGTIDYPRYLPSTKAYNVILIKSTRKQISSILTMKVAQ